MTTLPAGHMDRIGIHTFPGDDGWVHHTPGQGPLHWLICASNQAETAAWETFAAERNIPRDRYTFVDTPDLLDPAGFTPGRAYAILRTPGYETRPDHADIEHAIAALDATLARVTP